MEKGNINTKEWWNISYNTEGFYQDNVVNDWELSHSFIREALPEKPSLVMEVACGLAHNAKCAAEEGHTIIATDFSQVAINENKKRFADPKIRYECLSVEEATNNFKDLDVVMGFEIIEHFKKPIIPLQQISKCLKEGGIFIFSVPNEHGKHADLSLHYTIFNQTLMTDLLFLAGFKKVCYHKNTFTKECIYGVATK